MNEFEQTIEKLIKEVTSVDTIEINDIPNIELYMDQVTTFMENNLQCFKRYPSDKVLTKTMINNYAKARLFPAPVKKKYSRNHIMLLVIIYHLKTILSINDIHKLLSPITEELREGGDSRSLEIVYTSFIYLQKNAATNVLHDLAEKYEQIDCKLEEAHVDNRQDLKFILTILLLSIQANTEKRLAEKILDNFFPEPKSK